MGWKGTTLRGNERRWYFQERAAVENLWFTTTTHAKRHEIGHVGKVGGRRYPCNDWRGGGMVRCGWWRGSTHSKDNGGVLTDEILDEKIVRSKKLGPQKTKSLFTDCNCFTARVSQYLTACWMRKFLVLRSKISSTNPYLQT